MNIALIVLVSKDLIVSYIDVRNSNSTITTLLSPCYLSIENNMEIDLTLIGESKQIDSCLISEISDIPEDGLLYKKYITALTGRL